MSAKKYLLICIISLFIFPILILAKDKVNINTATIEQLEALTGIGPAKAQAIIDARPFSSLDELLKIKGIGEKTLKKIKDQGLASVEGETSLLDNQTNLKKEIPAKIHSTKNEENTENEPSKYLAKADISENMPKSEAQNNKIYVYSIALSSAVLSGAIILILKKSIS